MIVLSNLDARLYKSWRSKSLPCLIVSEKLFKNNIISVASLVSLNNVNCPPVNLDNKLLIRIFNFKNVLPFSNIVITSLSFLAAFVIIADNSTINSSGFSNSSYWLAKVFK